MDRSHIDNGSPKPLQNNVSTDATFNLQIKYFYYSTLEETFEEKKAEYNANFECLRDHINVETKKNKLCWFQGKIYNLIDWIILFNTA